MHRLTSEQLKLQERARTLAETVIAPRAAEMDRTEEYPWDNVAALTEAGFMGMTIPKSHGGTGLGYLEAALVVEEMAKVCGSTARIVVEGNMGAIGAIMAYGSEQQKTLAARLVLAGDKPAICITEPDAGSAATEMTTRADRNSSGYVINGKKHWITGGGVSKLHLIFARVFDGAVEQGIGGFIVINESPGETEGFSIGSREPTMGLRGLPETEIDFKNLQIDEGMAIVPPKGLHRGFAGLMNAYNGQRIGAATVALGLAQGAFEQALAYAKSREQFGRPIYEFQGLQWILADMSTDISAARALIHNAARCEWFPEALEAAQAKVFASEMAIRVTNDALQVFGAAGYSRRNPIERMVRDARMFTIGGGTAQILRTVIATRILGQKLPQTRDGYMNLPRATD
jgi:alkylation response protein AidB-like acyl-CoA dehydrogenase